MTGGTNLQQHQVLQGWIALSELMEVNNAASIIMTSTRPRASGCYPGSSDSADLAQASDELAREIIEDYLCGATCLKPVAP